MTWITVSQRPSWDAQAYQVIKNSGWLQTLAARPAYARCIRKKVAKPNGTMGKRQLAGADAHELLKVREVMFNG